LIFDKEAMHLERTRAGRSAVGICDNRRHMVGVLSFLGLNREQQMIAALVSVIVASVVVSLAAWTLLWRERRAQRASVPDTNVADADGS
jgi:hypothetical protein